MFIRKIKRCLAFCVCYWYHLFTMPCLWCMLLISPVHDVFYFRWLVSLCFASVILDSLKLFLHTPAIVSYNDAMWNSGHVNWNVDITPSCTAVGWLSRVFPSVLFCTSFCHIRTRIRGARSPSTPRWGDPECFTWLKAPKTWKWI